MELNEMRDRAHENATIKGFHDAYNSIKKTVRENPLVIRNMYISQHLMLLVSEVAEAQEALRHDDWANFKEELADIAIRLGDICGLCDIDLEAEVQKKMTKNASRPRKHGKEF